MFNRTVANDLMNCINSINDSVRINGNRSEINRQFSDILKMHSFLLELSRSTILNRFLIKFSNFLAFFRLTHDYLGIVSLIYAVFFAWGLLVVCGSLLLFQIEIVKYTLAKEKRKS